MEKQLINPDMYPDDTVLSNLLGKGFPIFKELIELFEKNDMEYDWKYYNDVKIWLCKAVLKKKTIVWMSANIGFIKATVYIPEKYIEGIYNLNISESTIEMIRNIKNAGKSKGCTFEIKTKSILRDFGKIMQYKIGLK